jgi:hypothetical protein
MRADCEGLRTCLRIRVGRDDDDRNRGIETAQAPQQVKSADAWHSHVGDDAVEDTGPIRREESLCPIERAARQAQHHQ